MVDMTMEEVEDEGHADSTQSESHPAPRPSTSGATPSAASTSSARTPRNPEVEIVNPNPPLPAADSGDDGDDELELKYGAEHVIRLFVPVSICMAVVVATMNSVSFYTQADGQKLLYTPFASSSEDSASSQVFAALGNAFVLLIFIIVMTTILILLYKFRCYKAIHGWLIISSAMLLTLFTSLYLTELFKSRNWCFSIPTVIFALFNYAAVGMICIHWKGPLVLQQAYLITVSSLMALIFIKYLPEWTAWVVLLLISVWDLVAVLTPKGPLRMLVQIAQERNEPIFPALIYSSGVAYMVNGEDPPNEPPTAPSGEALVRQAQQAHNVTLQERNGQVRRVQQQNRTNNNSNRDYGTSPPNQQPQAQGVPEQEKGIKLGLGDFIFYSVLVGKASTTFDWNTSVACYVAILVGLSVTLLLLALYRKALPALPISIFAGVLFYFSTRFLISPFISSVVINQMTY